MTITIPGEFTSLNDYSDAERSNRFQASKIKSQETLRVAASVFGVPPIPPKSYPVMVLFDWYTADARTDADNVSFAQKFILDGLVRAKVLENDSRRFVFGVMHICHVDKQNPRVEITFRSITP